jgi:hypothetical protein
LWLARKGDEAEIISLVAEGKLMQNRSIRIVAAIAVALVLSGSAHAASIVWGNVRNISGPGTTTVTTTKTAMFGGPGNNVTITNGTNDVNTQGTQVFGVNYSGTSGSTFPYDLTINGQNFRTSRDTSAFPVSYTTTGLAETYAFFGTPGAAGQSYGNFDTGGVGPATDYTLSNGQFSFSPAGTITLGNLTVGKKYLLQFWVSDARGGGTLPTRVETLTSSTGGDTNIPTLAYEAPGSIDGQWVTGTFTADSTGTQTLVLAASNTNPSTGDGGSAQVNLLQLRDITGVPEPTSLGLAACAALGLLARRRRA